MSGIFNEEDCRRILQNCYNDPSIKFVSFDIGKFSENVEGFLGDHHKLTIKFQRNGKDDTGCFFVKTRPTQTQTQIDACKQFNSYEKEILVYDTILKEFSARGFDRNFAPKCYLCKDNMTIVLELMSDTGFVLPTRGKCFTLSQIEGLLKNLALYHAGGFMLEEEKSKELGRQYRLNEEYGDLFQEVTFNGTNELFASLFVFTKGICENVIELLPESREFKDNFKRKLATFDVFEIFNRPTKCRKTIGHGDLWSNNMMFQIKNGVAINCCLLDYQILRYNHPGFDILLGIFLNTDAPFQKKYFDYLVHYYYGCLSNALKAHCYSVEKIMPLEDLKEGLKQAEFCARYAAMGAHTFTCTPVEVINEMIAKGDEFFQYTKGAKRLELFLESFQKFDHLREMITEDIYSINECINKI